MFKTPLAYMMDVMNDPAVPSDRRDRMAIAAAPYKHAKRVERPGKPGDVGDDDEAGETDWGDDLFNGEDPGPARPN